LHHQTGAWVGSDWQAIPGTHNAGFLVYGPYDTRFGTGSHRASFYLKVDNNTANPDAIIASLQVYTRYGQRFLGRRDLTRRDFTAANQWQWFTINFENPCFELLEANVYWTGAAQMTFGQLYIQK
jgi:hypothetical protein